MKAAVYHGPGDIRVEEVLDPPIEPEGAILRVKACGICGSDLHPYRHSGIIEPGRILGHELSGVVAAVGPKVVGLREGMRVTAASLQPCGKCPLCQDGKLSQCPNIQILGFYRPGALAEYIGIPCARLNQTVFPLPDEFSDEDGAMVEPLSVGANAVRKADPGKGEMVVILGAGAIGQCALLVFRACGVGRIIAADLSKRRLSIAKDLGADRIVQVQTEDAVERVRQETDGMGADIIVEAAGKPSTFQQAIEMVRGGYAQAAETIRPDGRIILVGIHQRPFPWIPNPVIRKSVRLIGCYAGDFNRAIEWIREGGVNPRPLITHRFSLDDIQKAFEVQSQAEVSLKVMVSP